MKYELIQKFETISYVCFRIKNEYEKYLGYELFLISNKTILSYLKNDHCFFATETMYSINMIVPFDQNNIEKSIEKIKNLSILK
jgi:hypothetical protein